MDWEVKDDDSSCIKEFKAKASAALQRIWGLDYLNPTELASAIDQRFRGPSLLTPSIL